MFGNISKLFHLQITSLNKGLLSHDPTKWPESWKKIDYKSYPRLPFIKLPEPKLITTGLIETLQNRTSASSFSKEGLLTIEELSSLLKYSIGIKKNNGGTNTSRRPYPSGGARYPLEIYLSILNVGGIEPGLYHYDVKRHGVEKLLGKEEDQTRKTVNYELSENIPLIIIFTAIWNRNFIKYKDFGYRIVLLEAGHAAQNVLLVGESLGLKSRPLAGYNTEKVAEVLDVDPLEEPPIYMILLGK